MFEFGDALLETVDVWVEGGSWRRGGRRGGSSVRVCSRASSWSAIRSRMRLGSSRSSSASMLDEGPLLGGVDAERGDLGEQV